MAIRADKQAEQVILQNSLRDKVKESTDQTGFSSRGREVKARVLGESLAGWELRCLHAPVMQKPVGICSIVCFFVICLRPAEKGGPRRPCRQDEALGVPSLGCPSRQQLGPQVIGSKVHKGDQSSGNGGFPP